MKPTSKGKSTHLGSFNITCPFSNCPSYLPFFVCSLAELCARLNTRVTLFLLGATTGRPKLGDGIRVCPLHILVALEQPIDSRAYSFPSLIQR
jgi:hypothetical protein